MEKQEGSGFSPSVLQTLPIPSCSEMIQYDECWRDWNRRYGFLEGRPDLPLRLQVQLTLSNDPWYYRPDVVSAASSFLASCAAIPARTFANCSVVRSPKIVSPASSTKRSAVVP